MRYFLVFFLLSVWTTKSLHAQKRVLKSRFGAGLTIGINTSQINGDLYKGFDKFGVFAGFRAIVKISTKAELVFEMQYSSKGSKNPEQFVPGKNEPRFISLNYIEVPILYHQKVKTKLGLASLEAGIAYGRLFGIKINENTSSINYTTFTSIQDAFNKTELALIIGGGFFINEHFRIMLRSAHSLTLLYENENPIFDRSTDNIAINKLRNIQWGLGVNYIF